jgi:hypothetical protein
MKTRNEIKNLRMIKVSFLAPTNTLGSRIKIYETNRYNDEKTESKVFSYDYRIGDVQQQAFEILQANDFNVICMASEYGISTLLCDNWGEDFKKVSELK